MKKSALRAISWVALLTLIAKGLGMLRDVLQARTFGTTAEVDLFTSANNYTIYLFTTAAYALCLAAVPIFSQKLTRDREDAMRTADNILTISMLFGVILAAVLCGIGAGVLPDGAGTGFGWYFAVMSLTLPLILVTYLLMALMQAMGHYSIQGSLSLLFNVALCVMLLAAGDRMSLSTFTVLSSAAWLLQLAVVLPYVRRERYRVRFRLDLRAPYLKLYFGTAVVTAVTTSIFLFCYLLDAHAASGVGEGVTAAFYYADKLFTPVTTTLIYSIGAVMFPKWSEQCERMENAAYRAYVGNVIEKTILLLLPLSALFSVFGQPIIRVLFEGGNFDAVSTVLTSSVFDFYALGMVGFALLDLMGKAYYAMRDPRVPLVVNLGVLALNFALNGILRFVAPDVRLFAAGTALALTAGGIVLTALFLRGQMKTVLHGKDMAAGLLLSGVLYGGLRLFSGLCLAADEGKLMLVVKCGVAGAVGFGLYLLLMKGALLPKKTNRQENE